MKNNKIRMIIFLVAMLLFIIPFKAFGIDTLKVKNIIGTGDANGKITVTGYFNVQGTTTADNLLILQSSDLVDKFKVDKEGILQTGQIPWARLTTFPTACVSGQYVSGVGASLTCSTPATGSQTPWLSDINAAGKNLSAAGNITSTGKLTVSGTETSSFAGDLTVLGNGTSAKGLIIGNNTLVLSATENLIYGNIDTSSTSGSNLLLLQNEDATKFRIDKDGKVIIGDTSTSYTLPTARGANEQVLKTDGSGIVTWQTIPGGGGLTGTTGQLAYFSGTNTAIGTSTIFISTSGNVGIGTTSPGAKLEVNGDIKAKNIGSVFTRWGNATAPAGTTLLYSGFGFSEHYSQSGGSAEVTCIKPGDPGAPGPETNYGDILYPLGTGDPLTTPPGITSSKEIKCAVSYAEGPNFTIWGTWNCPENWNVAYSGYGMGAYYSHTHQSNRHCVDNVNFDASVVDGTRGDIWHGSVLYDNTDLPNKETDYPKNKYLKCAVCIMCTKECFTKNIIPLRAGYTFIALPLSPCTSYTAEKLAQEINTNGGTVSQIQRHITENTWEIYNVGQELNKNMPIETGKGYFVRSANAYNWQMIGNIIRPQIINFKIGWNSVGFGLGLGDYKARSLLEDINTQGGSVTTIMRWTDGSEWQGHQLDFPPDMNNFTINTGVGYMIYSKTNSTFIAKEKY
ncbi:MAG: hypothetical protein ABH808_00300 [Candidatus Kuenenbacteria bacterium]